MNVPAGDVSLRFKISDRGFVQILIVHDTDVPFSAEIRSKPQYRAPHQSSPFPLRFRDHLEPTSSFCGSSRSRSRCFASRVLDCFPASFRPSSCIVPLLVPILQITLILLRSATHAILAMVEVSVNPFPSCNDQSRECIEHALDTR